MQKVHSNNCAPIPSDTKENQLCNISTEELRKCIDITLEAEEKVIDFIENNCLKQPDRIDYINYLIGFFVFNESRIDGQISERLINWYNTVDFTNKSNTERREMYADLIKMKI